MNLVHPCVCRTRSGVEGMEAVACVSLEVDTLKGRRCGLIESYAEGSVAEIGRLAREQGEVKSMDQLGKEGKATHNSWYEIGSKSVIITTCVVIAPLYSINISPLTYD